MLVRIGQRVAWLLGLWLLAGFLGAALVWIAPGFGIDDRELDPRWTQESLSALRATEGKHTNPVSFYADWVSHVVRGDLGESSSLGRPVAELLRERLPITVRSVIAGLLLGWTVGLGLAVSTFFIRLPGYETVSTASAGMLLCVPSSVIGLVVLLADAPVSWAIGAVVLPQVFSYARNLCHKAMDEPHVLAARAKGLGQARIFFWHVLVTIAPELLALAGVSVTLAFTASIPIEVICDSPGVGQLAWLGAMGRDLPLLVNITLIVTAITLVANALSDWATSVSGLEGAAR